MITYLFNCAVLCTQQWLQRERRKQLHARKRPLQRQLLYPQNVSVLPPPPLSCCVPLQRPNSITINANNCIFTSTTLLHPYQTPLDPGGPQREGRDISQMAVGGGTLLSLQAHPLQPFGKCVTTSTGTKHRMRGPVNSRQRVYCSLWCHRRYGNGRMTLVLEWSALSIIA